jgi:hypothetical protein
MTAMVRRAAHRRSVRALTRVSCPIILPTAR